ncbi:MAG: HD domain-containing phosphohydrolase [Lachnospiraceae bacterium]
MVTWFYFIVFLLALIMAGSFLLQTKNADSMFVLFSILVVVNCLGRYMLASAQTLEMAIWANKFLYVGGCFAPLLILIVLARLCNQRIPRWLIAVLTAYSTLVIGLVMTIGRSGIYYKDVQLGHGNGYNYLIKTYGPLHILYPIMMLVYACIMVFYLVYGIRQRKYVSFRAVLTLSGTCFAVIAMYILERILHSNISFLAVGYLIGIALLIKYYQRLNIYDMSANVMNSIEKMKEYGYLVVDDRKRYINANDYLKELFPEIRDWTVEKEIPESDSYLFREVVQYLLDWEASEKEAKTIQVGEQYFQMEIRELSYREKENVGYLIEFVDRTIEKKYYQTIEDYNVKLEDEVAEKTEHIMHMKDMLILGMADMVESRDQNTGGHIKRTSAVVNVFAEQLKQECERFHFEKGFLKQVEKAAPMHDLGKIAIDDAVLRKPGKYTDAEYAEMKRHPSEGAKIVENILHGVEDESLVQIAKNIALYHHEKWNGKGYPTGLSGTDIPMEARIMALADVFDALVSKRCYKEAFSYDRAFAIIEESLGEHFDPELGAVFLSCRPQLEALYDNWSDDSAVA